MSRATSTEGTTAAPQTARQPTRCSAKGAGAMNNPLDDYFNAWLQLQISRANSELKKTWDASGRRLNADGLYLSGAHINQLVADAKATTLKLAESAFNQAEVDGISAEMGPQISRQIEQFFEGWMPNLEARVAKIIRDRRGGVSAAIDRRISEIRADLEEYCKVAELKLVARSIVVLEKQSTQRSAANPSSSRDNAFPELNIASHRPATQRKAAVNYLRRKDALPPTSKIDALVADMKEKTGLSVSRDTMRRARIDLNAEA